MKFSFFSIFVLSLLFAACSSSEEKVSHNDKKTTGAVTGIGPEKAPGTNSQQSESVAPQAANDVYGIAATAFCGCMNKSFRNISPQVKDMVIRASQSNDPATALRADVARMPPAEGERLIQEFGILMDNSDIQDCTNQVRKTYQLDDSSPATQKRMLQSLEKNDNCQLVAALMRIGISTTEPTNTPKGQ